MMSNTELLTKQPLHENFKKIGKSEDFFFQALAYMGNASYQMSWANTVLENTSKVPQKLKKEMKMINVKIHELQEQLREIQNK